MSGFYNDATNLKDFLPIKVIVYRTIILDLATNMGCIKPWENIDNKITATYDEEKSQSMITYAEPVTESITSTPLLVISSLPNNEMDPKYKESLQQKIYSARLDEKSLEKLRTIIGQEQQLKYDDKHKVSKLLTFKLFLRASNYSKSKERIQREEIEEVIRHLVRYVYIGKCAENFAYSSRNILSLYADETYAQACEQHYMRSYGLYNYQAACDFLYEIGNIITAEEFANFEGLKHIWGSLYSLAAERFIEVTRAIKNLDDFTGVKKQYREKIREMLEKHSLSEYITQIMVDSPKEAMPVLSQFKLELCNFFLRADHAESLKSCKKQERPNSADYEKLKFE